MGEDDATVNAGSCCDGERWPFGWLLDAYFSSAVIRSSQSVSVVAV